MLPALLLGLVVGHAPAAGVHPQDGPDADVRIRIEPTRVRVAVVVNLAFADEIVEIPREDEDALHAAEHGVARELLFDYFRVENTVVVDGVEVAPRDGGFEVLPPDLELLPYFPRFGTRAMTKLRLLLDYPAKAPPARVELTWGPFPPDYVLGGSGGVLEGPDGIPPVEVVAHLNAGAQRERITFTAERPSYVWRDSEATRLVLLDVPAPELPPPLVLPVASVALWTAAGVGALLSLARRERRSGLVAFAVLAAVVGFGSRGTARVAFARRAPLPDEEQALAVFHPLHANIYRAFDYSDESSVYDALARSVHGDLLDGLYTQVHHSLVLQEEGGALSEVQAVRPLETRVEEVTTDAEGRPSFAVVALWQVDGAVFHWGHSHWRTNEYRARYGVAATDVGWRIVDDEVLEERRVDAGPLPPGAAEAGRTPPAAEVRDF